MRCFAALALLMVAGSSINPGMDLPLGQLAVLIDWDTSQESLRQQQDIKALDGLLLKRYKDKLLRSLATGKT